MNRLGLVLLLSLAPAAAAGANASADPPVDAEVLGFLALGENTANRDGSTQRPWEGAGAAQLKLSWVPLEKRNDIRRPGDRFVNDVRAALRTFYSSDGNVDMPLLKEEIAELMSRRLDLARHAYAEAVTWEERRLSFLADAIAQAASVGESIPGVDSGVVSRRARAFRSGGAQRAVVAQLDGYRDIALGLVAYMDGDKLGALERVRSGARALPDLAVAHAFLGSLYFMFDQRDDAVVAWRRARQLDPEDRAVADALREFDRASTARRTPLRPAATAAP